MNQPNPSILRQLINAATPPDTETSRAANAPVQDTSGEPRIPKPVVQPTGSMVEASAQPVSSSTEPALAHRESARRGALGLTSHLRILADNAPVAMAIFDGEMRYLYANHRWLEVFRLEQVDLVGRTQYEVFPSLHPGWRHVYDRALGGQIVRSDRDTVNQAGRPVLYRWEVRPWRNVDASVSGVMISCLCINGVRSRDVGEPQQASGVPAGDAAAEPMTPVAATSRQPIATLWDSALPMLALDREGRICRAGKAAGAIFLPNGLREGETFFWQILGARTDLMELRARALEAINAVASGAVPSAIVRIPPLPSENGMDVSKAWNLVKLSAPEVGIETAVVMAVAIPGLPEPGSVPLTPASHEPLAAVAPVPAESVQGRQDQALAAELAQLRLEMEKSQADEKTSKAREMRLRSVLDVSPCGLLVLDERGRPVFHNKRAATLLGRPMRDGQQVEEWLADCCRDEQHRAEVIRQWRENVWRRQLSRIISVSAEGGLLKDIELQPAGLPGGGMIVTLDDVTDERRAEEVLRATEAKFRTLVHENPLPIILADRSGAVFEVNPAAESMLGYTRPELRRLTLDAWMAPESISARATALREMAQRGDLSANVAVELRRREGEVIPANVRIAIVPDSQGLPAATVQFLRPVEKKEALSAAIADEPPPPPVTPTVSPGVVLLATDMHGRISQWSAAAQECFGVDRDQAVGRGLHTFFRPSDATGFYSEVLDGMLEGESRPVQWSFFHPEKGRMTGSFVIMPQEPNSLSIAIMSASSDVAPVEPAPPSAVPARPSSSDLERERLLLGETHHRVKNHLQIITSMLNLQLSTMHNEDAREALRASQNRVRSIAALHQHLYALAIGEAGSFPDFVSGLISHLRDCYEVGEDRVRIDLSIPQAAMPEEWLMPLSLSLNELVSNAFKHAYAEGRRGHMKIDLHLAEQHGELIVEDDGAGLPADFDDHKTNGLGLKIMRVFAGQLGGEVRVDSGAGQGASFRMRFPLAPATA